MTELKKLLRKIETGSGKQNKTHKKKKVEEENYKDRTIWVMMGGAVSQVTATQCMH